MEAFEPLLVISRLENCELDAKKNSQLHLVDIILSWCMSLVWQVKVEMFKFFAVLAVYYNLKLFNF